MELIDTTTAIRREHLVVRVSCSRRLLSSRASCQRTQLNINTPFVTNNLKYYFLTCTFLRICGYDFVLKSIFLVIKSLYPLPTLYTLPWCLKWTPTKKRSVYSHHLSVHFMCLLKTSDTILEERQAYFGLIEQGCSSFKEKLNMLQGTTIMQCNLLHMQQVNSYKFLWEYVGVILYLIHQQNFTNRPFESYCPLSFCACWQALDAGYDAGSPCFPLRRDFAVVSSGRWAQRKVLGRESELWYFLPPINTFADYIFWSLRNLID